MRKTALALAALGAVAAAATTTTLLPSGWTISPPQGAVATTGTMPQGLALSPDGSKLAIVESGYTPPALRVVSAPDLRTLKVVPLEGAFGSPVWNRNDAVLVAAANANAVLRVRVDTGNIETMQTGLHWPAAVAEESNVTAAVNDDGTTVWWTANEPGRAVLAGTYKTGLHPGSVLVLHGDLYVGNRGEATVTFVSRSTHDGTTRDNRANALTIPVDLHPSALAASPDGSRIYVACADADAVDVIDTRTNAVTARIGVGLPQGPGASPNGLAVAADGTVYVSLGAENAVAEIQRDRVVARVPAGWYPDGVAVDKDNVYVINGKGESSHANPSLDSSRGGKDPSYVGRLLIGSVRAIPRTAFTGASSKEVAANVPAPVATPLETVLQAHGPIRHVIYIIKENRTYDQVLGDVAGADGDPNLAWFGANVTPNQHAIAERFGIFDNTYTDAQVSASGHTWSTAALANDYLERFWPVNYGGRRDTYDFEDGAIASVPRNGYLWDAAKRAHITYRDYGEFVAIPALTGLETTQMPGLKDHIDPRYRGFDLTVSDEARVDEWQREFRQFVHDGNLPALEIVRLPNDHTSYTKTGALTPRAYVAQNDRAFGRIVDAVSHSPYWANTAVLAIEDDAQNGPDHVDDQRTTFYLASAYAATGVHNGHYSTSSVVRTIELLLGLPPMSIYDAVAPPLYDAFRMTKDDTPFNVLPEKIDVNERNAATAYRAAASNRMNLSEADAVDPRTGNDILAHSAGMQQKP